MTIRSLLLLLSALAACGADDPDDHPASLAPPPAALAPDSLAAIDDVLAAASAHVDDCVAMADAIRDALARHDETIAAGDAHRASLRATAGDAARDRWRRIVPLLQGCAHEPALVAVVHDLQRGAVR